jgi:hypothetical protein
VAEAGVGEQEGEHLVDLNHDLVKRFGFEQLLTLVGAEHLIPTVFVLH